MMKKLINTSCLLILISMATSVQFAHAQVLHKWLAVGSLHNFYSNVGTEVEHSRINRQQDGMVWPGIYLYQDAQAAKAMWLGATNWTDENGSNFPVKVIHVGPRVRGTAFVFPTQYELVSKVDAPEVYVDGNTSSRVEQTVDRVDPSIPGDRMIYSKMNTALGVTVERKIHQFSNENHDNYHLIELIFTNTGFTTSEDVKRIDAPITGFMYYEQNRWSPVLQTRYTIGNATGWGVMTMNDRRGDGQPRPEPEAANDPTETEFKAQFAWHGRFPAFQAFDNVGAPIITPVTSNGLLSASDTSGRLGAYHFVGKVHVHADTSPTDNTNDPNQPFTMNEVGSDDNLNSNNDPFNGVRMANEYALMTNGKQPRHAYLIEPTGLPGFLEPTKDPADGTSGGFSAGTGYGPYTLAQGQSVRVVYAEAVSGIGHEYARQVGTEYKNNIRRPPAGMTAAIARRIKNEKMFQGRDSLFRTFRRVKANFNSNFAIPQPPPAPKYFEVTSTGGGVQLFWDFDGNESDISGFEIYRSAYLPDSTAIKIADLAPDERDFVDNDRTPLPAGPPIRGIDYYYYIVSVSATTYVADASTPEWNGGKLKSSRYFTQTYDPARLLRPPGEVMNEIRIVPNPYIDRASDDLRFGQGTRIAFFDIPAECSIKIFTELGEFVQELAGTNSGDQYWDLMTKSRQRISSGVYIAIIENLATGEKVTKKFVVIF